MTDLPIGKCSITNESFSVTRLPYPDRIVVSKIPWDCPRCASTIPAGADHWCSGETVYGPLTVEERIADALERIADALTDR